ncbi:sorbosone dehydrogenase family protein (plasmid) [Ensifer adhaerens]|uniref:PQQ-dependent sugar dehydrogenase n=1 Tax=Ensifer adhaerens TaxID=106592 RepID=UPI001CBEC150|nr:sorbosone dehydrogenase family protein [Ensifer adhaerens]MBZ7927494.1 sorbosone dehydrogenase family protein [Ensifer adhaerens]UAX97917.1 sorbosone dehydrogenase family protein [Ensifer adhaerens]UAY05296.1 sorbosone dehydrogenase family protein [Ensifer adhaerens]UAY12674.1 sorbosone dehydrogenase family protein [Ensifer adhaerens]
MTPSQNTTFFLPILGLLVLISACSEENFDPQTQVGANPKLPEPQQYLFPPMHLASIVGWKKEETPAVAPGLKIAAFATGLQHPRAVYSLPNGDVLVVESKSPGTEPIRRPKDLVMGWIESLAAGGSGDAPSNRITLLRDADGDGVPEVKSVFIDHLDSPFGVALVENDLYVANTNAIMRFPYQTGQTEITATPVMLTALPGGPINHHWTKSLVASPDGTKLYVGVGSNSNITENGIQAEENRAAILEVDRASGAWRIFASGLRNPNGLTFEPTTKQLWTVVNERDELGPNLVPDYMTSVKEGGFYGWPYSYYGQHVDPRVMPQRPDLVGKALPPDYALGSHVAPLGLAFYTAEALPEKYRGGAFVGEHGSWNRQKFSGYKVVFVPFEAGHPSGKAEDVVTGFLNKDEHARGRPVGIGVDTKGALLIADDVGNTVWRVTSGS